MWNISSSVFLDRNPTNTTSLNRLSSLPIVYDVRGVPIHCSQHTNQYYSHTQTNQNSLTTIYQSTLTQIVWVVFWFLFLLLIAFPLALISIFFYALLCPISGVCSKFSKCTNALVQISQLPTYSTRNIIDSKALLLI